MVALCSKTHGRGENIGDEAAEESAGWIWSPVSGVCECQLWLYGQVACYPEVNPAHHVVPEEKILCGGGQGTTIELVA